MTVFVINQGDTRPILADTLTYSDGTSPDLSGATVNFVTHTSANVQVINTPATVVNSTSPATVSYTFTAGDTATPGFFKGKWAVTFADGSAMSFPTAGYITVQIVQVGVASDKNYTDIDSLKQFSDIQNTDLALDARLWAAISSASRAVDSYCGRRYWQDPTPVTRLYTAESPQICTVDDISTATGLTVNLDLIGYGTYDVALTVNTMFLPYPYNAPFEYPVRPYTELHIVPFANFYFPNRMMRPGVQVTAQFGWPAVPSDVAEATLIKAASIFQRRNSPTGIAPFGDMGIMRISSRQDPTVAELLSGYQLPAIG